MRSRQLSAFFSRLRHRFFMERITFYRYAIITINHVNGESMAKNVRPDSAIRNKKRCRFIFLLCSMVSLIVLSAQESFALPVFARKYHTACSTCHIAFPARNGFGEAFRNNGYRFPDGTDEDMVKEEPIKLGQDAYKDVFPDAIWPSDLPNMPSLGFLAKTSSANYRDPSVNGVKGKYRSAINEEVDIFLAGTITKQLSYIGDFSIDGGAYASDAAPTVLGRLVMKWTFTPGVILAWGSVNFPEQFDLISATAGDDRNGYAANLPYPNRGAELNLAGNTGATGGYSLILGVGRNSQAGSSTFTTNDQPDGANENFADTRYVRATYKIGGNGLLSGIGGSYGVQAIGMDNSITFGVSYLNSGQGSSLNNADQILGLSKNVIGGDVRVFCGPLRAVAQYTRSNEVIYDPYQFGPTATGYVASDRVPAATPGQNFGKRDALSLEGDYWVYPWLFGLFRYEHLQDNLNGRINRFIPGIGALLRPNVKIGVEWVTVTNDDLAIANGSQAVNSINFYSQVGF